MKHSMGGELNKLYMPYEAEVVERIHESPSLFTLRLRFTDPQLQETYEFEPGQFNMLYLYGVGEVAISIVSDPKDSHILDHTIRMVGRVTQGLGYLKAGDRIGVRGPYGRGWPMQQAEQGDVVVVTGGLGCAPVVSVINYIARRRERFGHLNIVQGVKHSDDFIWHERYDQWREIPDTTVLLAADQGTALWPWHIGRVTDLFDNLHFDPQQVSVMMCGPEGMMHVVTKHMLEAGVGPCRLWLSMERNMQCAVGHCGHCQYGDKFICKDGPVFCYEQVADLFNTKGF
jgi:sulfhydrogenase subunit gamma (sulfur reductase)